MPPRAGCPSRSAGRPTSRRRATRSPRSTPTHAADRPVYFGYVTAAEPIGGLEAIVSPPPEQQAELNWLNVFYAIEWIVFAGFAVFVWYRLVKDAVQREREEAELEAERAAASGAGAGAAGRRD
jgi:surfeit locus 1 family protein